MILAKTVKGYGMGDAGEAENDTHSVKKLDLAELKQFRDRFNIPLSDSELEAVPYYRPSDDSAEMQYLKRARARLGGPIPRRVVTDETLDVPGLDAFKNQLAGTGKRTNSTTMGFVRLLASLVRDKNIGSRIVPIVPDEARTFGMEGMFRQLGIYSSKGQLYEPEDSDEIAAYRESKDGQVLEEGINEAGAMSAWISAATSYSNHGYTLVPFYIYYSMFGFQRIGDLAWLAGDIQARGFLLGGTAGRTTLNGEGLQHQDGHSHILASTIPNCISYDPCYTYELAVIVQAGLERMYAKLENVFYYITVMNEAYQQPPMPESVDGRIEDGILRGMYPLQSFAPASEKGSAKKIRLLGSGTILREVLAAGEMLANDYGVSVDVFSVTSFNELTREMNDVDRRNLLNPGANAELSFVQETLPGDVPIVAATDYMRNHAEQIRSHIEAPYRVLGTDGFGRSDTRAQLRHFFEVDRRFVTLAALMSLAEQQQISHQDVAAARDALGIDPNKPNPRLV